MTFANDMAIISRVEETVRNVSEKLEKSAYRLIINDCKSKTTGAQQNRKLRLRKEDSGYDLDEITQYNCLTIEIKI